jgi:mono/diheme cytochrome c family protein
MMKNITIAMAAIFLMSAAFLSVAPAQDEAQPSDPAAYYKAKCQMCHGPKAEKKFDASLTDEQYVDVILKGKKPEGVRLQPRLRRRRSLISAQGSSLREPWGINTKKAFQP